VITGIEIDGFKSFVDFTLDVPPFMALVGPNASGKSNLIDALRVLADVVPRVPLASGRGTPTEVFHQRSDGSRVNRMRLTVDSLSANLLDDRGLDAFTLSDSFEYVVSPDGIEQVLTTNRMHMATDVSVSRIASRSGSSTLRETLERDQDGDGSSSLLNDLVRGELMSWHFLNLDPGKMRDRGLATDNGRLARDGSNLAAVLGRISRDEEAMWDLAADVIGLVPTLQGIRPYRNGDYWEFALRIRSSGEISARLASDGTLRILAVMAALHDPRYPGVVVIDEVENGLHPSQVAKLLERMRGRITDWRRPEPLGRPLRQVIFTTHSPVVLSSLLPDHRDDIVFMTTFSHPWNENGQRFGSLVTRARTLGDADERMARISEYEARQYLETVSRP
jgi:predicted ATPase